MGISRSGSRGSGGLLFGTGTSIFADNAGRDTYFTANPNQLTQYNNNEFLLIQVGTGFQRRHNDTWIIVTNIVRGPTGVKGDTGPPTNAMGQHLATMTFPPGINTSSLVRPWVLEPNIPSGISGRAYLSVPNADLVVPKKPVVNTQRGWLAQLVINDAVESEAFFSLGAGGFSGGSVSAVLFGGDDAPNITVSYFIKDEPPYFAANPAETFTIDPANTVELKLSILQ